MSTLFNRHAFLPSLDCTPKTGKSRSKMARLTIFMFNFNLGEKIMNKAIFAFPIAAFFLTAHLAFAADEAPKNPKQAEFEAEFKAADTNGDGGLSQEELAKTPEGQFKSIKNNFDKMDVNKDGKVTIEEMEKWIKNARYRFGK
jgi:hypothetical protein